MTFSAKDQMAEPLDPSPTLMSSISPAIIFLLVILKTERCCSVLNGTFKKFLHQKNIYIYCIYSRYIKIIFILLQARYVAS